MAHIPRHDEIIRILSHLRSVSVQELTQRLGVSEVTIRKDLSFLEEMGSLLRTRGGAKLAEDQAQLRTIQIRREENLAAKECIAATARAFVSEDDTIYVDSGSTCLLLARLLTHMNLRIVTDSLDVMNATADAPGISLISVGGSYRKDAGSFIGPLALETLKGVQIQTCFIGTTGLSATGIFSCQNIIEAELKARVLRVCKRRIVLADRSKFGKDAFAVFARAADVDILVTDSPVDTMRSLTDLGIEVIVAGT